MTFREALDRRPQGLDERHAAVAQLLMGRREGVTRADAVMRLPLSDRAFRQCVEDITASGWLPIVADRTDGGEARYRIVQADEPDVANAASREDQARAISLHKRARGRLEAFQRMHQAGSLFLEPVEPLEVA